MKNKIRWPEMFLQEQDVLVLQDKYPLKFKNVHSTK